MQRYLYILYICLISFSFSGCATTPISPPLSQHPTTSQKDRMASLNQIKTWDISGKVAIRTANDSVSATLEWQQVASKQYTISLYGPLGANRLTLTGLPDEVSLTMPDGKVVRAKTIEQLLVEQSGWHLPVSYLYYWIRGLPVPKVQHIDQFDNEHRLLKLAQAGWQVEFLNYTTAANVDLPNKIFIHHPDLTIKIIINQWHTPH